MNGRYIVSANSFHFHCGSPKATKKEIRIFYLLGIVHIALSETEEVPLNSEGFNQYHLKMKYKHQVRIKDTSLLSQNKRERQIRLAKNDNIAMRNSLFRWKLILTYDKCKIGKSKRIWNYLKLSSLKYGIILARDFSLCTITLGVAEKGG